MTSDTKNGATILDSEVVVIGNIAGQGDVELRGRLQGNLRLEGRLVVAQGATMIGNVEARSVLVAGSVHGDIEALEGIEIQGHGSVEGSMIAPRIGIETGAQVRGLLTTAARPAKLVGPPPDVAASPPPKIQTSESDEPESFDDDVEADLDDIETQSVSTPLGDEGGPLRVRRRRRRRRKRPEIALATAEPRVVPSQERGTAPSPDRDGPPRPATFQKGVQAQRRRS